MTAINPPPGRSPRKGFALTGPSVTLDPRTNAVRPDLADVRLAEQVFAPHYAAPVLHHLTDAATLMAQRSGGPAAELSAGDAFEVLDLVGDHAWGVATAQGLVGYVGRAALDLPA